MQYWAKAVQQDEEKVLNKIQKAGNAERIREKKKKASTLKKAENRQNEIDRLFAKMYEDRACEKITERNFVMLSSKYQKEQIELEQQITSLREELSKMEQDMIGAEKWIELIKEYSVPKELTAPLLNAMIEKILIHEATTNEDNERIQEIVYDNDEMSVPTLDDFINSQTDFLSKNDYVYYVAFEFCK